VPSSLHCNEPKVGEQLRRLIDRVKSNPRIILAFGRRRCLNESVTVFESAVREVVT